MPTAAKSVNRATEIEIQVSRSKVDYSKWTGKASINDDWLR
jgi:hypothetical protein